MDLQKRDEIIAEARSFIGTPYHIGGRLKGVGVDCATLLLQVLVGCKLIPDEDLGIWSGSSWQHWSEEKYLLRMLRHAHKVFEGVSWSSVETMPGNIALVKAVSSKVFNHGGIVVKWPKVIHANSAMVVETDASVDPLWAGHELVILDVVSRWQAENPEAAEAMSHTPTL